MKYLFYILLGDKGLEGVDPQWRILEFRCIVLLNQHIFLYVSIMLDQFWISLFYTADFCQYSLSVSDWLGVNEVVKISQKENSIPSLYDISATLTSIWGINTLRSRKNGQHFSDDILKCIFLKENVRSTFHCIFFLRVKLTIFQH